VSDDKPDKPELLPESIRVVRLGHGANCSSIGSVVDTLFASAVIGGAVLAAVLAAMRQEKVVVVGSRDEEPRRDDDER
jgi:hypothetical protein